MAPKERAKASTSAAPADDDPLFFYLPDAEHGELCQWFPSRFSVSKAEIASLIAYSSTSTSSTTATDGAASSDEAEAMHFNCTEQFMMYCKAGRFHDTATQARIMATASPKEQKRLGKMTTGFYDASWDEVKSDVVVAGNMAKFGQNLKLKGKLLATGDRLLVEASGRDRVWGIGYATKHAVHFREHWGENRLGKALMVVRERLRQEGKQEDQGKRVEEE